MGSIYRSEEMSLCQIFLQTDAAYSCIAELGELGLAQFLDLNEALNSYQRKFVNEVRRCDEMERKMRFIEEEVIKDNVPMPDCAEQIKAPQPKDMLELEATFEKLEEELLAINSNTRALQSNHDQLTEMAEVIEKVKALLDMGHNRHNAAVTMSEQKPLVINGVNGHIEKLPEVTKVAAAEEGLFEKEKKLDSELKQVAGVISRDKVLAFERLLWRMCKGKVFLRTMDCDEEYDFFGREEDEKSVFILFFSGEQLGARVNKICHGFRARIYNCPEGVEERHRLHQSIQRQLEDLQTVIDTTLEHRARVITAASKQISNWKIKVLKLKMAFHTLNMFSIDVTQKCLVAECWIPTADLDKVRGALSAGTAHAGSMISPVLNEMESHETPPTYFRLNKFTQGFQNIVDAFGIANYREVNPAPWTIISFPFIFAVMFGDVGHALIMFIAALLFVLFEERLIRMKIKDEIFNTFFGGRYVILLMSIFSVYTGLIYNDFYSKSVNIFGSSWKVPYSNTDLEHVIIEDRLNNKTTEWQFDPQTSFKHHDGPYPFGVDPIWNLASNKLNFLNALKMKSSVIIGITQMTFGVFLSLANHIHNHSTADILFMFLPQMLFLGSIFIYLCVQIVIKWIFFTTDQNVMVFGQKYPGPNCAPSLLIGLINMFMMKSRTPGFVEEIKASNGTVYERTVDQCDIQLWYPHQDKVEQVLLVVAVVSIPIMLLVKPFYLRWRNSRGLPMIGHSHGDSDEFNFADVMVYQAIHTIEFALGCISHTASYLRLWALSLAHAQLSEVLWDMLLHIGLTVGGWAGAVGQLLVFIVFAVLSVSILVLMEGLSAFLHALRLHWVEFQSKFYGGTGIQFEPFSFAAGIKAYEGLE